MLIATHTVQLCRPISTLRKKEELHQSHPFLWELTLQNQLSGHPAFDAWFWWSPYGSTNVMTRDAFQALVEKAVPDPNRHYRWVGLRMLVHFCRARDTIWNRYNFPTFERVVDSCRTGCNCRMFTKKLLKNGIHRFGITRLTTGGFSNIVDGRIIIYNRSIWAIWTIALVTRLFSLFLVPWATCSYGAQLVPPSVLVKFLFHDISFLWHDFFWGLHDFFWGGTTLFFQHDFFFSARLFLFGTTLFFWHDSFFFATTFSFWHDFLFSARLFLLNITGHCWAIAVSFHQKVQHGGHRMFEMSFFVIFAFDIIFHVHGGFAYLHASFERWTWGSYWTLLSFGPWL